MHFKILWAFLSSKMLLIFNYTDRHKYGHRYRKNLHLKHLFSKHNIKNTDLTFYSSQRLLHQFHKTHIAFRINKKNLIDASMHDIFSWFTILFVRRALANGGWNSLSPKSKGISPWPPEIQPFRDKWQTCSELEGTSCEDKIQAVDERIPACVCRVRVKSSAVHSASLLPVLQISFPGWYYTSTPSQTHWPTVQSIKVFKLQHPTIFPTFSTTRFLHKASADIRNVVLFGQPCSLSLPTAPS